MSDVRFQEAVEQVARQACACDPPELDTGELEAIVAKNTAAQFWQPSTAYEIGDRVTSDPPNGVIYACTQAGTSDITQPNWPAAASSDCLCGSASGSLVTDGSAVWQQVDTYMTLIDTDRATSEAWHAKAGKAAALIGQASAGQNYQMSQVFTHCRQLANDWDPYDVA